VQETCTKCIETKSFLKVPGFLILLGRFDVLFYNQRCTSRGELPVSSVSLSLLYESSMQDKLQFSFQHLDSVLKMAPKIMSLDDRTVPRIK
jgi:hypothetical protein